MGNSHDRRKLRRLITNILGRTEEYVRISGHSTVSNSATMHPPNEIKRKGKSAARSRPKFLEFVVIRLGVPLGLIALGIALMAWNLFYPGIVIMYLGAALFGLDIMYEKFFSELTFRTKIVFVSANLIVIVATSWLFIFVPAHFKVSASSTVPSTYGPGSKMDGIDWQKQYSVLRFHIMNDSNFDYENFDAEISTDLVIGKMRLFHGISECKIAGVHSEAEIHWQHMVGGQPVGPLDDPNYDYQVIPVGPDGKPIVPVSGGDWSYRIYCNRIPANTQLDFVSALEVVNEPGNAQLYGPPKAASWISLKARFQTSGRSRLEIISRCPMGKPCETKGRR